MLIDLHMHTNFSDGQYSPAELIALTEQNGDDVIAITDHDTVLGVCEAAKLGVKAPRIIAGIEFSSAEYGELHILGYNIDVLNSDLNALCEKLCKSRDERKYRIIEFLHGKGVEIELEDVEKLAGGDVIARPHFARALVERGCVETNREAFNRYLDTEEFHKIERFKPDMAQCISAIHNAGGKAVWAHPGLLKLDEAEEKSLLCRLIGAGIDGIEAVYSKHSDEQTAHYKALAAEHGLFVTAGSDYHGEKVKPNVKLGRWEFNALPF